MMLQPKFHQSDRKLLQPSRARKVIAFSYLIFWTVLLHSWIRFAERLRNVCLLDLRLSGGALVSGGDDLHQHCSQSRLYQESNRGKIRRDKTRSRFAYICMHVFVHVARRLSLNDRRLRKVRFLLTRRGILWEICVSFLSSSSSRREIREWSHRKWRPLWSSI